MLWPMSDQDLSSVCFFLVFFFFTISKLLHKTLLETKQLLRLLCRLPPLHSRIPPLLQRLFLPGQRHRIATALSHSPSLSTISGQVLECHLKICLTSPGEGNACNQFNCKFNYCPIKIFIKNSTVILM